MAADDARHLVAELVGGSRGREADVADVVVEIEVGVVDPVRMIEPERNVDEAPAHRRQMTDERAETLVHDVERLEIGRRPLVDRNGVDVPVRVRRLHVQEARIEP